MFKIQSLATRALTSAASRNPHCTLMAAENSETDKPCGVITKPCSLEEPTGRVSGAPGAPGLHLVSHRLSPVERQNPDPDLLPEGVHQDVRVTSGWWRRRNSIWTEAPGVTAGAHQRMTKHVPWLLDAEDTVFVNVTFSPLRYLELVTSPS